MWNASCVSPLSRVVRLFALQFLAAFITWGLGGLLAVAVRGAIALTIEPLRTAGWLLWVCPFIGAIAALMIACLPRQTWRFWQNALLSLCVPFFCFIWLCLDSPLFGCLAIGTTAALLACFLDEPWWWRLIHFLFAPMIWAARQLSISPFWHLAAFVLLLLVFRGAASGRIPLFLSGEPAARRLAALLPGEAAMLDVGAGVASLLLPLARLRPDLRLTGIENAPLPWIVGWLRTRNTKIDWRWGDFWRHSLSPYPAVYCFLSPAPMPELWQKARKEMRSESLFISNAFPVPDVKPEMPLGAESGPALYVYRVPNAGAKISDSPSGLPV
ncbi:MAG: hypothetical protein LBF51_07960 [Zoogloeaceae bacterium]|jgi:hypothetical protein|nr:hypothetical protein [Zoogloeaceae bacterium]